MFASKPVSCSGRAAGLSTEQIIARGNDAAPAPSPALFATLTARRVKREPMAYIRANGNSGDCRSRFRPPCWCLDRTVRP